MNGRISIQLPREVFLEQQSSRGHTYRDGRILTKSGGEVILNRRDDQGYVTANLVGPDSARGEVLEVLFNLYRK